MAEIYAVKTRGIGLPDYAQAKPVGSVPVGPVYTSTDIAELAARQDSPDTFDRHGNVVFIDGFEDGIGKWLADLIDGGSLTWEHIPSRSGGFAAKLTTDPAPWAMLGMMVLRPFPVLSNIGFEFSCSFDNNIGGIEFYGALYDGTYWHTPYLMYWTNINQWFYHDEAMVPHGLKPTVNLGSDIVHSIKFVADYIGGEYVRLIVNDITYDLSGLRYRRLADAWGPFLYLGIYTYNNGAIGVAHIDDVIITYNEPASV